MATVKFVVRINVCGEKGECKNVYTSPHRTLKDAQAKFDRIVSGEENYGQFLYPAEKYGVMLSISRVDGKRIRTMQIN